VKLHLAVSPDGTVSGNVDSPDQNLFALPCADLRINGQALSFTVPNVRGEWMGTLSADGASLTGIWKQGAPVRMNFTRSGGSSSGGGTPGAAVAPAGGGVSGAPGSSAKPCTAAYGASYWDGSSWKPMVMPAHLGSDHGVSLKDGLKNPFNNRAGITSIVTFKNAAAALTLDATPKFCVPVSISLDPTVVKIGILDVKKDHRELETCSGPWATKGSSTDDWMPEKRVELIDIRRVSDTLVEVTPKAPLKPGQYILGGPPMVAYYDFGVTGGAAGQ